jgi:hypothetical protein
VASLLSSCCRNGLSYISLWFRHLSPEETRLVNLNEVPGLHVPSNKGRITAPVHDHAVTHCMLRFWMVFIADISRYTFYVPIALFTFEHMTLLCHFVSDHTVSAYYIPDVERHSLMSVLRSVSPF